MPDLRHEAHRPHVIEAVPPAERRFIEDVAAVFVWPGPLRLAAALGPANPLDRLAWATEELSDRVGFQRRLDLGAAGAVDADAELHRQRRGQWHRTEYAVVGVPGESAAVLVREADGIAGAVGEIPMPPGGLHVPAVRI